MSDSSGNIRRGSLKVGQKAAQAVVFLCIVGVVGVFFAARSDSGEVVPTSWPSRASVVYQPTPISTMPSVQTKTPAPRFTPHAPRIGVVAGHWWLDENGQQSLDVGAVCDEGSASQITELEINLEVAQRVVFELRGVGYQADLLQEWDDRLNGYRADVLLSIHADACLYPEATGFKVARVADSHVPEVEDRLVACIVGEYAARTGLEFHEGSITHDMTRYHTFYEIDPSTPGAIIEVGFMLADRQLLRQRPDLVAQGIIDGILCFLEGEGKTLE
jgi:N-acetylmuramoyl-L-alanine amidase